MALYDQPTQITEVLLADGWHPVMDSSFLLSGPPDDTQTEFSFVAYIAVDATRVLLKGAVPSILGAKSDPRQVGQLDRRHVQPDGHLQVLKIDGIWYDVPEIVH